jgi:hypothetical protein
LLWLKLNALLHGFGNRGHRISYGLFGNGRTGWVHRRHIAVNGHYLWLRRNPRQDARLVLKELRVAPVEERDIVVRSWAGEARSEVAIAREAKVAEVQLYPTVGKEANLEGAAVVRAILVHAIPAEQD